MAQQIGIKETKEALDLVLGAVKATVSIQAQRLTSGQFFQV